MKRLSRILLVFACTCVATGSSQAIRLRKLSAESKQLELQFSARRQQLTRKLTQSAVPALSAEVETSAPAWTVPVTGDTTFDEEMRSLLARLNRLKARLLQEPRQQIPELRFLDDCAWFEAAKELPEVASDFDERSALSALRSRAVGDFYDLLASALRGYLQTSDQQLPDDLAQLKPHFVTEIDDTLLARYEMLEKGSARFLSREIPIIAQRKTAMVDPEIDQAILVITLDSN